MTVRRCLLALAVLALAGPAAAQAGRVEITTDPEIPVVGLSTRASIQFLDTRPQAVSLLIRTVGETTYRELAGADQGDGVWTATLDDVSPRGIEVFSRYTLDGRTITEPFANAEAVPFRVPVIIPAATSAVSLPARQYRMVTVPLQLGDVEGVSESLGSDDPLMVFGDDFGADGDPARWRLLRWDPVAEAYRDAVRDRAAFERVRPGAGYWLIAGRGGTFDVEVGLSTGATFVDGEPRAADVTIPLQSGWNQIGNPFLFPVRWADVDRPPGAEDPVDDAFVGGQATLEPWRGYFVFNAGPEGVLRFRTASGGATDLRTLAERVRERAGIGAAALTVTAVAGDARDEVTLGIKGMAPAPPVAPADLRKPPPVDAALRLAARADGQDWLSQFRPRDEAAWTLALTLPADVGAELRLETLGTWPSGVVVDDLDRGETLPVVAGRVRVDAVAGVSTRRLVLRAGAETAAAPGPDVWLGTPRPNPAWGAVTLPYASAGGPARLDVVDVLGRSVRSVDLDAASGTATWDGRDAAGEPVAAGLYLVRLSTPAGAATVRVTRLR